MTIDERLDRLTERHEALTQSVEMLLAAQRENEQRFATLATVAESCLDSIRRLERIATAHEKRLKRLEKNLEE